MLTLIHKQQGRSLTLFTKYLGMRYVFPCGDAPIDATDIVTGLILAYFCKIDPAALLFL